MANVVTSENIDALLKSTNYADARTKLEVGRVTTADIHDLLSSSNYAAARAKLQVGQVTAADMLDFLTSTDYADAREKLGTGGFINNITELKARVISQDTVIAEVLGWATAGDEGGGLFVWDATNTDQGNAGTILTPSYAGFSGTGRWLRVFSGAINVKWFGAKGDNINDDALPITSALDAAVAGTIRNDVYIPSGTYKLTSYMGLAYTGSLSIYGDDNTILYSNYQPSIVGVSFAATNSQSLTLVTDIPHKAKYIHVASVDGVQVGDALVIATTIAGNNVTASYNYDKGTRTTVSKIDTVNKFIYLTDESPFHFLVTGEAISISFRPATSFTLRNLTIEQGPNEPRFDIWGLTNVIFENIITKAYKGLTEGFTNDGDVVFMGYVYNFYGKNLTAIGGRYNYNVSKWSRNIAFEDITAINGNDFADFNHFSYNCSFKNFVGTGMASLISPHPSFESHYDNVTGYAREVGIGMRSIGGSIKNSKINSLILVDEDTSRGIFSPNLTSAYEYLADNHDVVYENVDAKAADVTASDCNNVTVKNCKFRNYGFDAESSNIRGIVTLDDKTTCELDDDRMAIRRVNIEAVPAYKTPKLEYGSLDVIIAVTGITNAVPAVVTTSGTHAFVNDSLVRLDGVQGMSGIGRKIFMVKNVTATTFQLYTVDGATPIDTSLSGTLSGSPKATQYRAITLGFNCNKMPIVGNYPKFHYKTRLFRSASATAAEVGASSKTYPIYLNTTQGIHRSDHYIIKVKIQVLTAYSGISNTEYIIQTGINQALTTKVVSEDNNTGTQVAVDITNIRPHFNTQCTNEGSLIINNEADTNHYISFDVAITNIRSTQNYQLNLVTMDVEMDYAR